MKSFLDFVSKKLKNQKRGENEGGSGQNSVGKSGFKTPLEIEESIQSTPTVTWDPFTFLPKEIYFKIFNKLESPTDKQNFMNANMKFYDLFKAERVDFLFGKIFGALTVKEEDTDKDFICLRLVCREWDESIKNYYQLHPNHFQFSWYKYKWTDWNHLKAQYARGYLVQWEPFTQSRKLETNLNILIGSHPPSENPFLVRKISIRLNSSLGLGSGWDNEGLLLFWNQLNTLLSTYGRHVWHFCFEDGAMLTPEMYSRIIQWLHLLPELKTLEIKISGCGALSYETKLFSPELKNLEYLHVSGFPPFAFNKLLERNKCLEKLEVDYCSRLSEYQLPVSLTDAVFTRCENYEFLNTRKHFPNLRKIIINKSNESKNKSWPEWKTIWTCIETKMPNLEELHLSHPMPEDKLKAMEQTLDFRLNLPELKRLTIILPSLCSIDFLLDIRSLQELTIYVKRSLKKFEGFNNLVRRERVQFNRDLATLWKSNIWKVFPKLKKLSIHDVGTDNRSNITSAHSYKREFGDKKYKKNVYNEQDYFYAFF